MIAPRLASAIDLFCGMGGATEGLRRAGLDVALAVDAWSAAVAAHRRWHPDVPVVRARVEDLPLDGARPWLCWASPSCKPWSTANRTPKRGLAHREYYSTARLVRQAVEMGVRWLVVENVGGLLWSREGKVELAEMRAEAQRQRLCWYASIVNSNTVGVAQIRRRLFIVVGPEYVRIPHGNDYIPPENAEATNLTRDRHPEGKAGWRDGGIRKASADAVRAGTLAHRSEAWDRPKAAARGVTGPFGASTDPRTGAIDAVGQVAWSSAPLRDGAHGREWATAKRGVVHARLPSRDGVRGMMGARFLRRDENAPARSLAECCDLQQVPHEIVAGLPKRVAHELIGNVAPAKLVEHVVRTLLAVDRPS